MAAKNRPAPKADKADSAAKGYGGKKSSNRAKIGDTEIKALVAREISLADSNRSILLKKQVTALEYYQGVMKDVPNETGRSAAMSRDLADVLGWILPGIMRVYTASEHMAVAEPVRPEDVAGAAQATDDMNYTFWKDNDGYRIVYNATWDSLLIGDGIVKVWWDSTPDISVSVHSGLTDDQITMLLGTDDTDDEKIEVVEHSPSSPMVSDGQGGFMPDPNRTHDLKIRRTVTSGRVRVDALAPENYGKDGESKTCDESRFQYHREQKTRSDLIKMGFDKDKVQALNKASDEETTAEIARDQRGKEEDHDPSMDLVDLFECFVRVDIDGDGIGELCRVYYGGSKDGGELLDWEEWDDELPFDSIPCQPMPHKFESGSLADETMDVQRIKTAMLRQALDNTYATNNPQRFVTGKITNPEELFSPTFGGAIFGEKDATVAPLTVPFVANHAYDAINYMDQVIERRTGVSRTTMALDPDALQNQTATANQNARDAAYSQIELIARNQAELGWKKVFRKIMRLQIRHQNKARIIRMRGQFTQVDPRQWNADMDVTINVGLGTGSRDRDIAALQAVLTNQTALAQQMAALSPAKALEMLPFILRTLMKQAESAGIKSPEMFYPQITDQDIQQAQQAMQQQGGQQDPRVQAAQVHAQSKTQAAQMAAATAAQVGQQRNAVQAQYNAQKIQAHMESARMKAVGEQQQAMAELGLKRETAGAELAMKHAQIETELAMRARMGVAPPVTSSVHVGGQPG